MVAYLLFISNLSFELRQTKRQNHLKVGGVVNRPIGLRVTDGLHIGKVSSNRAHSREIICEQ